MKFGYPFCALDCCYILLLKCLEAVSAMLPRLQAKYVALLIIILIVFIGKYLGVTRV